MLRHFHYHKIVTILHRTTINKNPMRNSAVWFNRYFSLSGTHSHDISLFNYDQAKLSKKVAGKCLGISKLGSIFYVKI